MQEKKRITEDMLEHMEILSKLALTPEEKIQAAADMEQLLAYVDLLQELDTEDTEEAVTVFPFANVFREDVVTNGAQREVMLSGAPERKGDTFVVPKTRG